MTVCTTIDKELKGSGIQFHLKYVGNIPIESAMKEMTQDFRKLVVNECIYMVADAVNLVEHKRNVNPVAKKVIGAAPPEVSNLVSELNVSSKALRTIHSDPTDADRMGGSLMRHKLEQVSVLAPGKEEIYGFVGYVAKDEKRGRRCYVFKFDEVDRIMNAFSSAMQLYIEEVNAKNKPAPVDKPYKAGQFRPENAHRGERTRPLIGGPTERSMANETPRGSTLDGGDSSHLQLLHLNEPWYHGLISRGVAESRLKAHGDFLVRQSVNSPGQVILSGREDKMPKHILLIDKGVVRTRDREFSSVPELINYHREQAIPIVSEESSLQLIRPIPRPID